MDTAWYRLFFWGRVRPGAERRSVDRLSKALIQMRDWCASVGRDTNREKSRARKAGGETWRPYRRRCSGPDRSQSKRDVVVSMSIKSQMSREIRRRCCLFERLLRHDSRETSIKPLARTMMAERPFREAEHSPRGRAKDSGAHRERCCLSIMQSSAINNDGVLTITF